MVFLFGIGPRALRLCFKVVLAELMASMPGAQELREKLSGRVCLDPGTIASRPLLVSEWSGIYRRGIKKGAKTALLHCGKREP